MHCAAEVTASLQKHTHTAAILSYIVTLQRQYWCTSTLRRYWRRHWVHVATALRHRCDNAATQRQRCVNAASTLRQRRYEQTPVHCVQKRCATLLHASAAVSGAFFVTHSSNNRCWPLACHGDFAAARMRARGSRSGMAAANVQRWRCTNQDDAQAKLPRLLCAGALYSLLQLHTTVTVTVTTWYYGYTVVALQHVTCDRKVCLHGEESGDSHGW